MSDESFICHRNRFFNLKQFATWCSVAKTRKGSVVAVEGWGDLERAPEGETPYRSLKN